MARIVARRASAALIACALAGALALLAGCGSGDPAAELAVVREGGLFASDPELSAFTPVAADGVVDVAYDASGRLWYTRDPDSPGRPDACELHRAGEERPRWRYAQLAGATGLAFGLCWIGPDPRGGLLFTASAGTTGSIHAFSLDPDKGTVRALGPGDSPAIAPDGSRLVLARHRYREGGGSYEQLVAGDPDAPRSLSPISPPSRSLHAPAFSPDGRRLAVVSVERPAGVAVGVPEGPWRRVFASRPDRYAVGVAWLDGRTLAVLAQDRDGRPALWRIGADGGPAVRLADAVSALAVR